MGESREGGLDPRPLYRFDGNPLLAPPRFSPPPPVQNQRGFFGRAGGGAIRLPCDLMKKPHLGPSRFQPTPVQNPRDRTVGKPQNILCFVVYPKIQQGEEGVSAMKHNCPPPPSKKSLESKTNKLQGSVATSANEIISNKMVFFFEFML